MRLAVLYVARFALSIWMLVIAFVALGSLIGSPAPFVLMGCSVGALPFWAGLRWRWALVTSVAIAVLVTVVPVMLLVSYGEEEGGITGISATASTTLWMGAIALCCTWLGLAFGRLTWRPWLDADGAHSPG